MQLELECIGFNEVNDLVRISGPNPDDISQLYVARDSSGQRLFFRADVPESIRKKILSLPADALWQNQAVQDLLECKNTFLGKTYTFPSTAGDESHSSVICLSEIHERAANAYDDKMDFRSRPVYALFLNGIIVATCQSSRENNHCAEAWVRTLPEYRRRGFGRQVTAVWARAVRLQNKIPFYSHSLDNAASQSLANKLELKCIFEVATYG